MWSILENVPCALEKKVCSSAFEWNALKISMRSISSNVSYKTCVSLLIICFDDLSIGVSGVLKSPTIIASLSILPFMFVSVCLRYWGAPMLGASVQFSCSVVSDSLWPHESQHSRPPCPWPTPGVHSNSCPPSRWCHPAISSSVVPFSFCPQSLPASESFQMSPLFAWGSQSIGVSASASVLPMNTQDWFTLGWTSWISLQSKGLSRVFFNTTVQKHQFFSAQPSSQSNSHIHTWP